MICNYKFRLIECTVILLFLPWIGLKSQNLLINPGAEDGPPATNGWTVVNSGSNCSGSGVWRVEGNQGGFPPAHSGTYYFYPGCALLGVLLGQTYELYQDVDVSANAAAIDINGYGLTFSGYTQSKKRLLTADDGTTIIIEVRNAAHAFIGSYSIGETQNDNGWTYHTASALLPVGTRFVRVRLIGTFHSLLGPVGAYFDDLSLTSFSVTPVNLTQFNAVKNRGGVFLNWQTVNKLNNKGFTIMRSSDGSNWSDLGFIANNQNAPVNNYSFEDQSPLAGRNFYKLREIGIDGAVKYSERRTV